MIHDEFTMIANRAVAEHPGHVTVEVVAIEPSDRGPVIRWRGGSPRARERGETHGFVSLGPPAAQDLIAMVARFLQVRWRGTAPRVERDWDLLLTDSHPQIFKEGPHSGPGWSWLWEAAAERIEELGVPDGFITTDTKEKFGQLRWYCSSNEDRPDVENVIECVDYLSAFICEDCGAPGRIRPKGWMRCLCDAHAKDAGKL